jgi:hypothetical protein
LTRRISIVLTDDELACLAAAAKQQGRRVSAYLREQGLFAAGWGKFSGPLFVPTEHGADRDRSDAAVAHSVLRHVVELSRHVRQRYAYHEPPHADTPRMLVAYVQLLSKFEEPIRALRRVEDARELVERLWMNGRAILEHHALLGNAIVASAEKIEALLAGGAVAQRGANDAR